MADGADEVDFIIVGAGSAGCVLANRLSADPGTRVLVLEAGGRDRNPWIHVPAGFYRNIYNPKLTWQYETEPEPQLDGRRIKWPRGRVLGGTSSINGLIYIRGQREDFDLWRQMGNVGWSYDDVLPYFRRSEDQQHGEDAFHGVGGPLSVSDLQAPHELHDAFIQAGQEAGYPLNPDFNGASQDGVGAYQLTIRGRRRSSTAAAYLRPALKRPNLRVETGALVERVLLDGRRATGVRFRQDGRVRTVAARREVVLAGGAVNSPQLLQLSGIGSGARLQDLGIEVAHDLPGVGENLQDHIGIRMVARVRRPSTVNDVQRSLWRKVATGLRYLVKGQGPLMMGAGPLGLFARTRPEIASPDVQFHFLIASSSSAGGPLHDYPGCTLVTTPCRPESRGSVHVASPDPETPPKIHGNYFSTRRDRETALLGLRMSRRLFEMPALREQIAEEMLPGRGAQTDDQLWAYIRASAGSSFHPTSTCMMGSHPLGVVDAQLRIRGIERLRVADASIMPTVVSGNTNAATIMIGEKAADLLRS